MKEGKNYKDLGVTGVTQMIDQNAPTPTILFACRYGSHLYGMNTEESDLDVKAVFVEELDNILVGNYRGHVTIGSGGLLAPLAEGGVDIEYIELRKFIQDALRGQTYAVEMLFCNAENIIITTPLWGEVVRNRKQLVSQRALSMLLGYSKAQAHKYGVLGARVASVKAAITALQGVAEGDLTVAEAMQSNPMGVVIEEKGQHFLEVNGKKIDTRLPVKSALEILQRDYLRYGARALRAADAAGVDWKAISHAYRCAYEALELAGTGGLQFPLSEHEFLLRVKKGHVPYEDVGADLPRTIALAEERIAEAAYQDPLLLAEAPDEQWWHAWLVSSYRGIFNVS